MKITFNYVFENFKFNIFIFDTSYLRESKVKTYHFNV